MSDILSQEEIDALLAAAPDIQKAAEEKPQDTVEYEEAPEPDFDIPDDIPEPDYGPAMSMDSSSLYEGDDSSFIDEGRASFGAEGVLPTTHDEKQARLRQKARPAMFGPLSGGDSPIDSTNLELILDTSLQVRCELGRARRRIKDILELGPGSVIELNKLAGEAVDLLVNERFFSKGEVVVIDQSFGVRVTDILGIEERIELLT